MPKDGQLFSIGLGEIQENIPRSFMNMTSYFKNHHKRNISIFTNNLFDTLFYIPSTEDILKIE